MRIKKRLSIFISSVIVSMLLLQVCCFAAGAAFYNADGTVIKTVDEYDSIRKVSFINLPSATAQGISTSEQAEEWKTVTYNPTTGQDSNTVFTVSAKGNDIKIKIESDYINGDDIYCAGTVGRENEIWGAPDGLNIFHVSFSDTTSNDPNTNHLQLDVSYTCGKNAQPCHLSLSNDVTFSLLYKYYEENQTTHYATVGQYYDSTGRLGRSGYSGKMSACDKMDISVAGNKLTVVTTLPDEVVDYYNEGKRDMNFDSDNLRVSGVVNSTYYVENSTNNNNGLFRAFIERTKEVIRKFYELLRKFFTFN